MIIANEAIVNKFINAVKEATGVADALIAGKKVAEVVALWEKEGDWENGKFEDVHETVSQTVTELGEELPDTDTITDLATLKDWLNNTFGEQPEENTGSVSGTMEGETFVKGSTVYVRAEKANEITKKVTLEISAFARSTGKDGKYIVVGKSRSGKENHRIIVSASMYEKNEALQGGFEAFEEENYSANALYFARMSDNIFKSVSYTGETATQYGLPSLKDGKTVMARATMSQTLAGVSTWKCFDTEVVNALGAHGKMRNPDSEDKTPQPYVNIVHNPQKVDGAWSIKTIHGLANAKTVKLINDKMMSFEEKLAVEERAKTEAKFAAIQKAMEMELFTKEEVKEKISFNF
jgi:hypothetical protein